ncbi:MAG: TonB-dependent receptor plug domain-containing protein [Candidatus Didemnitutus sp.]|nr:TonB-dependent receptor plug domain-containing protein [Candidatus Didemnitutus sp.]
MNTKLRSVLGTGFLVCAFGLTSWPSSALAQATAKEETPDSTTSAAESSETVVLSPFKVTTTQDKGYRATNTISGTRLDTAIKDLPMPIEVITEAFIRDTGSDDLRQSLRYSSGIILQSQNDQGSNTFHGAGGVHNPEGATANKTQSTFKIRGYITDVVLRDGYRRQSATDSVNIGRVEVIRGPAALLYGIGNFGGIVNYLPKEANMKKSVTEAGFVVGTNEFMRGWFDTTGPLGDSGKVGFRVSGAWQDHRDHTELFQENHWFVSPSFTFQPTPKTEVVLDLELGQQNLSGIGFQSVRARSDIDGVGQADRLQSSGFVQFAGKDNRTFRWSGPDTYRDSEQSNLRFQVTQEIMPSLNLLAGYNRSNVTFDSRDVNGSMRQNVGPAGLRGTITVLPIDVANGHSEYALGQTPNTIFEYLWSDTHEKNTRDQFRFELNYGVKLFENSKWMAIDNSFLFGRSIEKADSTVAFSRTANNTFNYKNPTDTSYIRFGKQGNGAADAAMVAINRTLTSAENIGDYAVYQGKFFDERLIIVGGLRRDKNDNSVNSATFHPAASTSSVQRPTQSETTDQIGAMVKVLPQVSIYALRAGGVQPNFGGLRDAAGNPLGATIAESKEIGIKIDLMEGRLSGTISKFKIERSGVPFGQWWMPTLKGTFNPARPITYNVANFSPSSVPGGSNGGNGAADAALPQWNAGVTAGAIYQLAGSWYVNASAPTGAAYLDRVFALTQSTNPGWPGWLYITDANTNNGWEDRGDGNGYQSYVQQQDESDGWDAQILFSPTDNFQLMLSYAHTKRVITNPGKFIKYPHPQNRWAVWYFPDGNWGLTGYKLNEVYTDPSDTSTWTGIGWGAGQSRDDTPAHSVSAWANYRFTSGDRLKGLELGLGGQWESEREYFSGITVAGQKQTNAVGQLIVLKHKPRLNLDLMARYPFKVRDNDAYLQLNVNNVMNDKDLYGLIYAPGRSVRLEFGYTF